MRAFKRFTTIHDHFLLATLFLLVGMPLSIQAEEPGDSARGARQWANNCARCHNFRNPKEFPDYLWKPVITHMRVQAGLTGQQARDILAYMQASNNPVVTLAQPVAGASSGLDGAQIYRQTCQACHGANGEGVLPGVPDYQERLSKSDATLLDHITNGFQSPGSPMAMPAKGGNSALTGADIKAVLAYIRKSFSN